MSDPLRTPEDQESRYFSPPPPGLRERLASLRKTLLGTVGVVVVVVVVLLAVGWLLASGDGKGSGVERAFRQLSAEDQRLVADVGVHQNAVLNGIIQMVSAGTNGKPGKVVEKADAALRSLESASTVVARIDNGSLREVLGDITDSRRRFVSAYRELVIHIYRSARPRGRRAKTLLGKAERAARAFERAEEQFVARVRPYMTAEERRDFSRSQQRAAERMRRAVGGR